MTLSLWVVVGLSLSGVAAAEVVETKDDCGAVQTRVLAMARGWGVDTRHIEATVDGRETVLRMEARGVRNARGKAVSDAAARYGQFPNRRLLPLFRTAGWRGEISLLPHHSGGCRVWMALTFYQLIEAEFGADDRVRPYASNGKLEAEYLDAVAAGAPAARH